MVQFDDTADVLQAVQDVFITGKTTSGSITRNEYVSLLYDRLALTTWNTYGSGLIDPTRQAIALGAATNVAGGGTAASANSVCIQFLLDAGYSLQFPKGVFSFRNINMNGMTGRIIAGSGAGAGGTVFRAFSSTDRLFQTTDSGHAEDILFRDFQFHTNSGTTKGCSLWVSAATDAEQPVERDLRITFDRVYFRNSYVSPVCLEGNIGVYFNQCRWLGIDDSCFVAQHWDSVPISPGGLPRWDTARSAVNVVSVRDAIIYGVNITRNNYTFDLTSIDNSVLFDDVVIGTNDTASMYKNGGKGLTIRNSDFESNGEAQSDGYLFEFINVDGVRFIDNSFAQTQDPEILGYIRAENSTLWCRGNTMAAVRRRILIPSQKQTFVTSDGTTGTNNITIKESYVVVDPRTFNSQTDNVSDILAVEINGGTVPYAPLAGTAVENCILA